MLQCFIQLSHGDPPSFVADWEVPSPAAAHCAIKLTDMLTSRPSAEYSALFCHMGASVVLECNVLARVLLLFLTDRPNTLRSSRGWWSATGRTSR